MIFCPSHKSRSEIFDQVVGTRYHGGEKKFPLSFHFNLSFKQTLSFNNVCSLWGSCRCHVASSTLVTGTITNKHLTYFLSDVFKLTLKCTNPAPLIFLKTLFAPHAEMHDNTRSWMHDGWWAAASVNRLTTVTHYKHIVQPHRVVSCTAPPRVLTPGPEFHCLYHNTYIHNITDTAIKCNIYS